MEPSAQAALYTTFVSTLASLSGTLKTADCKDSQESISIFFRDPFMVPERLRNRSGVCHGACGSRERNTVRDKHKLGENAGGAG